MILFDNPTDKWVCASCRYETKEHLGDWDTCPNCDGNVWAEPHYKAWKTEPPTVEGWYWVKIENRGVKAYYLDGKPPYNCFYHLSSGGLAQGPLVFTHYLGPLPIPE